jgi:inner membrane transporter RhtA
VQRRYLRAVGLVLIGIASVQVGAAFAKQVFDHTDPLVMMWLRNLTGALLLGLFVRPNLRGRSREAWLVALSFGLALGVMNWSFYEALARIPLGIAVTIEFLGPLLLGIAMSRRATDLLWILLAFAGVAMLGFEQTSLSISGVSFALLAAVTWAAYIVLSKRTAELWEGLDGLTLASAVAAAGATVPALFALQAGILWEVVRVGVLVGVLSSLIPYSLDLLALRTLRAHTFAVLMSLEPAAAALAGLLVLGELLTLWQWTAVALVVLASLGANWSSRRQLMPQGTILSSP